MTDKTGLFITLEGGEGTGKSTLLSGLAERMSSFGKTVVTTREPGGTILAEAVRELALHPPESQSWSPMAEALLMNAARANHLDDLIRPSLLKGHWVLSDRFSDSTLAYQSIGGVPLETLRMIETAVLGDTTPDMTFVLDAPPEALITRRKNRGVKLDAFEARPLAFHDAVRERFLAIAKGDPARYIVLDALAPADAVLAQAWSAIGEHNPQKSAATL
jgi:dTMP kinase